MSDAKEPDASPDPTPAGIPTIRKSINEIDAEVLELLARRRGLSEEIALVKEPTRAGIRDQRREEELLVSLIRSGRARGLDAHFVTRVYQEIIDDSIRLQQELFQTRLDGSEGQPEIVRIAFQGIEGAYSHLAAKKHFSAQADRLVFLGLDTFADVVDAVEQGQADYAMLPVENTTSGGINEVYDLLLHTRLSMVAEEKYRVNHCLVAGEDVPLASIRSVYSHPQALAQCSHFVSGLANCKVEYFGDTAKSVSKIKRDITADGNLTQAAIASEEAARMFGLTVLKRDIANQKENYTRFLIAARTPRNVDPRIPCKTSLVMATAQRPGSLVEALLVFRDNRVNLTKLESRPILGNPWEEMFYVDFEGNTADESVRATLDALTRVTRYIKVLGCYPSQALARTAPPSRTLSTLTPAPATANTATPPPQRRDPPRDGGYRLASRDHKPEDSIIDVKGVAIGGPELVVIAGPCSVESFAQIVACARVAKEHGASVLRGGCFRHRTSPYSFQGLGFEGLDLLADAGQRHGLPVITEIVSPADVETVAAKADILQIGARNMQNFTLLSEVGRVHVPVMLKRGLMSSIDELLNAAEYILAQGNQQVILCERGIRTFETATQSTLDLSAVPILRDRTHLPVLVDPAHAAGKRELVPPLAKAAKAAGAQGIMLDIHPSPEQALTNGRQALYFADFQSLMSALLA